MNQLEKKKRNGLNGHQKTVIKGTLIPQFIAIKTSYVLCNVKYRRLYNMHEIKNQAAEENVQNDPARSQHLYV